MTEKIHVILQGVSAKAFRDLLASQQLDLDCGGPRQQADGTLTVDAFVSPGTLAALRKRRGLSIVVDDAFTKRSAERQREVGQGDRFKGGSAVPRGPGRKTK